MTSLFYDGALGHDGGGNGKQKKFSFISNKGLRFDSFKTVIDYMESSDVFDNNDVDKIKHFRKEESVDTRRRGYDWSECSTLPAGWKKRPGVGKNDSESILSPEGQQFRSRFNAVQNMVKNGCPLDNIDQMKDMLIHEGWETIDYLPDGWLFKRIWEGTSATGRVVSTIHYMADDGELFESAKSALEHIESNSVDYTSRQVETFKEFQTLIWKTSVFKRGDWFEDETVPTGWKRRVIGASGRESILRPDGKQYMSRITALQAMTEENYEGEIIQSMRSKLCHEGWGQDNCLPEGWLYKMWESTLTGKTLRSYRFLSPEGSVLESVKMAMEFMRQCGTYSRSVIRNCKKFLKKGNRNKNGKTVYWNTDLDAPVGWKSRMLEGRKCYLMPNGKQFPSLFSAFQYMANNDFLLSQINVIRSFLHSEGWNYDNLLPNGWQVKSMGSGSYWYIGRYGEFFENTNKAVDYISSDPEYTEKDYVAFDKFKEEYETKGHEEDEISSDEEEAIKGKKCNEEELKEDLKLKVRMKHESLAEDWRIIQIKNQNKVKATDVEPWTDRELMIKLSWISHESLPEGWKIRKVLNRRGRNGDSEVYEYQTPDGKTIEGKMKCFEFMNSGEYDTEDIEKIWRFNWDNASGGNISLKRKRNEDNSNDMKKYRTD